MKRVLYTSICLSLTFLIGCGKEERVEYRDKSITHLSEQSKNEKKIEVFKDEVITEQVFVVDLRAGDKVMLKLSGQRFVPTFDSEIFRESEVTWTQEGCLSTPDTCFKFPRKGKCNLQYRKHLQDTAEVIDFTSEDKHSLRLFIGEAKVDLGTPVLGANGMYSYSFIVSEVMLKDSDELFIKILSPKDTKVIKTGFVGTVDCKEESEKDFKILSNTNFKEVEYSSFEEFKVSLEVQY